MKPAFTSLIVFLATVAASWVVAAPGEGFRVGGFVSSGYLETSRYNYLVDSEEGSWDFVELGLNASWTPRDRMTVNGQLFAFELGDYGNYEPQVDYLFVDYNFRREFGLRLGRVKRELGVYAHVQDIDVSRASVLLPIGIYDQRYRDISASLDGVSAYGNTDLWEGAYLDYNVYAGLVDIKSDGGVAGFALTRASRIADNVRLEYLDSKYRFGGQLWLSPGLEGFRIGLGVTQFPNISFAMSGTLPLDSQPAFLAGRPIRAEYSDYDMTSANLAFEYFVGEWTFVGEYVSSDLASTWTTTISGLPAMSESGSRPEVAWYLGGARRLGNFEFAITHAEFYENDENRSGEGLPAPSAAYNKDTQFSVRYDVTEHWSLKAEIHSIHGTSRLFNEFQQNPVLDEEAWTLFAAKSTFSF